MSTNQKLSLCFFQIVKEQGKTGTTQNSVRYKTQRLMHHSPRPPSLTGLGTAYTER